MTLEPELVSMFVAGFSALVSLVALAFSVRAHRENYHLAKRIADQSGSLRSATINLSGRQAGYSELVLNNGPTELTVVDVWLQVTYRFPCSSRAIRPGPRVRFWVNSLWDDFSIFGISGPSLPLRLAAYDDAVWRVQIRSRIPADHWIEYVFGAKTSGGEVTLSSMCWFGIKNEALFSRRGAYSSFSGGLAHVLDNEDCPQDVKNFILNSFPQRKSKPSIEIRPVFDGGNTTGLNISTDESRE